MNSQQQRNEELFKKQWNNIYKSEDSKLILVGNVEGIKIRKQGSHYIFLNKSRKQRPHRDDLQKKVSSVFVPFDANKFSFSSVSNKQVLFYVNLDEEVIIAKEDAHKITENFFDKQEGDQEDQIQSHTHPIIINTSPICKYHSLLAMYPDEELPQVVGSDIILLLLNIFKILPNVKVGYNSVGGGASVNNLHFHVIYSQQVTNSNKFPIEEAQQKSWVLTSLINPHEQINLYSVGVHINQVYFQNTVAFVLKPYCKKDEKLDFSQVTNSLSFVFGIIINELIQLNIPHNILISEGGQIIYIIVRDFDFRYAWLQFTGVIVVGEEQFGIKQQKILEKKKSLQIDKKTLEILKSNIKKHLSKFI